MRKKPGYKTSEFWFTLVSFLISGLFLAGVITEADTKDDLINAVTHGVESIILIGGQFMVLSRYLKKRKEENIEYEKTKQKAHDHTNRELEDYIGVDKKNNKININTATIGELIQLPHVGPTIAERIVDYRSLKQFEYIQQMIDINGIGGEVYKDIEPHITI